ncbi:hypothetical protein IP84_02485 [beta proteobacterium AAP99]|nr:hypothetical protein IP84_02485 [beta proteobacterium AAP99]
MPAASFAYDPLGRRAGKTVGAATTGFLYDGANFVQELSEANTAAAGTDGTQASLIANLLTAGIDQTLLRQRLAATGTSITSSTPEHLLRDANNNTLGITNAQATPGFTTRYDYDAYGNVSQSTQTGTPSDNSQQYTGRENDNTGLMYYRARYYLPGCARFISEDPIGWASGQTNNYAYVGGNPVMLTDPSGLEPPGNSGPPACSIIYYTEPGVLIFEENGVQVDVMAARTSNPYNSRKLWSQKNGPIPPGVYNVDAVRTKTADDQGGAFCDASGNCWSAPLIPGFPMPRTPDGLRSDFAIHPDGGKFGTNGCIGCTLTDSSSVRDFLKRNRGCPVTAY